jgi:uncharacterized protein YjbI with pentapeptide repeats
MSIKIKSVFALSVLFISAAAFSKITYNPADLDRFINTNQCPHCDLSGAAIGGNHSKALLAGANLTGFMTDPVILSYSDLSGANLSHASLSNANLSYASFQNAFIIQARFCGSNMEFADFTGAIINDADFSFADLYGAKITSDQLARASSICNAILPDGLKGKC